MYRFRESGGRHASENTATEQRSLRERFYLFRHSRLWLGAPGVAIVSFLLFFLLRTADLPVAGALSRGALAAVLMVFCWSLGIWATTKSDEKPAEAEEEEWVDRLMQKGPVGVWVARIAVGLLLVLLVAAVFYSQLEALVTGSEPVLRCVTGILLRVLAIVAVVLPGLLSRRLG